MVRQWNRLPREAVMVPSLLQFKKYLDNTLRHLVTWSDFLGGPVGTQELDSILMGPWVRIFCDSMITVHWAV